MTFNDVFFVMQKQSGGTTPGLIVNHQLLDVAWSRLLTIGGGPEYW